MNIISNSCVGAFLYRDYFLKEYTNPFCWNYIESKDMYNLIANYNNINFLNYELVKDNNWNFSIIIDNLVKVNYVHYKFNPHKSKLFYHGNDISSNNIWKYIIKKYNERVNRMLLLNEDPTFILSTVHENSFHKYDPYYLNLIDNLNCKNNIFLFSNLYNFKNKYSYNFDKNKIRSNYELAKYVKDKILCLRF